MAKKSLIEQKIEEVKRLALEKESYSDILRALGLKLNSGNFQTLKKYARLYGIRLPEFDNKKATKWANASTIKSLEECLIVGSTIKSYNLKKKLIKQGVLKEQCAICDHEPIWNSKPLVLQLDHINGISNDNRLENLRLLCPNCHSQTETFCSKARKC